MNAVMMSEPKPRTLFINGTEVVWEGEGARINPTQGLIPPPADPIRLSIKRQIWDVCLQAGKPLSRRDITQAIGYPKSTWLYAKMDALVEEGYLTRSIGYLKNGLWFYTYEVKR